MLDHFLTYINDNHLFSVNDKLLVAVSGGKDSMVLLHLLRHGKYSVAVAHVNFQLRGDASNADENFVRNYCEEHNISFFSERYETKEFAQQNGISTQMAARELRYEWFERLRNEQGFDYLLTAHHRSDNLETVLLNLTRGTGIAGLTGIAPKHNAIVRPLLFASRSEIDNYALKNSIKWREDASNASTDYDRNLVRHKVIPLLKTLNPSVERGFERSATRLKAAEYAWDSYLSAIKKATWKEEENRVKMNVSSLKNNLHAVSILEAILKPYGFSWQQLTDAQTAAISSKFLTTTHTLFIEKSDWVLVENERLLPVNILLESIPEKITVRGNDFSFEVIDEFPTNEELRNPKNAFLALEKMAFPLCIRTWKNGDRFSPFGMKGTKLLSDFFIDEKLSIYEKETQLLLADNQHIAWIVGQRISQQFAILKSSKKILKIRIK